MAVTAAQIANLNVGYRAGAGKAVKEFIIRNFQEETTKRIYIFGISLWYEQGL
jgi:hypothetical protein